MTQAGKNGISPVRDETEEQTDRIIAKFWKKYFKIWFALSLVTITLILLFMFLVFSYLKKEGHEKYQARNHDDHQAFEENVTKYMENFFHNDPSAGEPGRDYLYRIQLKEGGVIYGLSLHENKDDFIVTSEKGIKITIGKNRIKYVMQNDKEMVVTKK